MNQVDTYSESIMLLLGRVAVTFVFCAIYDYTGSILPGAIVHSLWHAFTSQTGFVFINSTNEIDDGYFRYVGIDVSSQSLFIDGESFGADTSLFAIIIYFVVAAFIWTMDVKKRHSDLTKYCCESMKQHRSV